MSYEFIFVVKFKIMTVAVAVQHKILHFVLIEIKRADVGIRFLVVIVILTALAIRLHFLRLDTFHTIPF